MSIIFKNITKVYAYSYLFCPGFILYDSFQVNPNYLKNIVIDSFFQKLNGVRDVCTKVFSKFVFLNAIIDKLQIEKRLVTNLGLAKILTYS